MNQLQEIGQDSIREYELLNLTLLGDAPTPVKVLRQIEGKEILLVVDSGAPFFLITESTYVKHKHVFPELEKTNIRLQTYTKHRIDILGVVNVKVKFHAK